MYVSTWRVADLWIIDSFVFLSLWIVCLLCQGCNIACKARCCSMGLNG